MLDEEERPRVLERTEKVALTVEHKVPEMEVECWELERGLLLHSSEHLKITGRSRAERTSIFNMILINL